MKRVRATIIAVEKQSVLDILSARVRACVRVCSLRHPACSAHAPYCHLWPAQLCNSFPHYLINGTIFEKKTEQKICFDIFYNLRLKHFIF
jgi:hypothetical protein